MKLFKSFLSSFVNGKNANFEAIDSYRDMFMKEFKALNPIIEKESITTERDCPVKYTNIKIKFNSHGGEKREECRKNFDRVKNFLKAIKNASFEFDENSAWINVKSKGEMFFIIVEKDVMTNNLKIRMKDTLTNYNVRENVDKYFKCINDFRDNILKIYKKHEISERIERGEYGREKYISIHLKFKNEEEMLEEYEKIKSFIEENKDGFLDVREDSIALNLKEKDEKFHVDVSKSLHGQNKIFVMMKSILLDKNF